jgi:hypothetical protein
LGIISIISNAQPMIAEGFFLDILTGNFGEVPRNLQESAVGV